MSDTIKINEIIRAMTYAKNNGFDDIYKVYTSKAGEVIFSFESSGKTLDLKVNKTITGTIKESKQVVID